MKTAARSRAEERRRQRSSPEARARRRQQALARKAALPMAGKATIREPLLRKAAPRPKRRVALWITGVLTVGTIFGLATFHVMLVQSEFRLDKLTADAEEAQQHYEHLRLELARLSSPERIVASAQQRLGMVIPPQVGYLTAPQPNAAENNDALSGGWEEVKPFLAGRP
jgi:cell division protein FtsL